MRPGERLTIIAKFIDVHSRTAKALLFIALTYSVQLFGIPQAVAQKEQESQLEADIARLDALRSSNDLDAMRTQIDLDSERWQKRGRSAFVLYMYGACGELSSYDIGNSSQRALLLGHYAISVLQSGDLPLQQYVQFAEFLGFDPPVIDEAAWKELRRKKAQFWLEAWLRVSKAIDPGFDFDERPLLNVPPPPSTHLPAGIAPSSVKDPQLRAEYEHAIAENRAKIERYGQQSWLKLDGPRVFKEVEQYLVNAYSRAPSDPQELQQLLSRYIEDASVRERVLREVRKPAGCPTLSGPHLSLSKMIGCPILF
ncbi:MAG TPA: hypothetical protein VHN74_09935 [Candidatus Angelobacter sp.]|nr:hypothetical protein [Candidatus Angelobacter sp.]